MNRGMNHSNNEWITIEKGIFLQKIQSNSTGLSLYDYRHGSIVKCSYKLFMFVDTDGIKTKEKRTGEWIELETRGLESFQIGENDMVKGLETIFLKGNLNVGDKIRVRLESSQGYGDKGRPAIQLSTLIPCIPPNTDLEYLIEIADCTYPYPYPHSFAIDTKTGYLMIARASISTSDNNILTNPDSISETGVVSYINYRKEVGNRWFKFQNFDAAAIAYNKGALIAEAYMALKSGKEYDKKKLMDLYIACLNNHAACHISRGNMIRAKAETRKVLNFEPTNVKALLRTARASLAIQDWDDCENCLETILKSTKPQDEWYVFAENEMKRLEKAKEKFYADGSPEAKVRNAAMAAVRITAPITPIETLSPEESALVKSKIMKKSSKLTLYLKSISSLMIIFCSLLILYVLFFDTRGLTKEDIMNSVKNSVEYVKSIKLEDAHVTLQKVATNMKSWTLSDIKVSVYDVSVKAHETLKSITLENASQKLLEFKNFDIKNTLFYEKLLEVNAMASIVVTEVQKSFETLKNLNVEDVKSMMVSQSKQVTSITIEAVDFLQKEGAKTISSVTGQVVEELPIVEQQQVPSFTNFSKKVVKDGPVVMLFTSIMLAIGKNVRF